MPTRSLLLRASAALLCLHLSQIQVTLATEEARQKASIRDANFKRMIQRLPPGVLNGIEKRMGMMGGNISNADLAGPLAAMGLPFNPALIEAFKQHLTPGKSVEDIKSELADMLFEEGDMKEKNPSRITERSKTSNPKHSMSHANSTSASSEDEYEYEDDYEYREGAGQKAGTPTTVALTTTMSTEAPKVDLPSESKNSNADETMMSQATEFMYNGPPLSTRRHIMTPVVPLMSSDPRLRQMVPMAQGQGQHPHLQQLVPAASARSAEPGCKRCQAGRKVVPVHMPMLVPGMGGGRQHGLRRQGSMHNPALLKSPGPPLVHLSAVESSPMLAAARRQPYSDNAGAKSPAITLEAERPADCDFYTDSLCMSVNHYPTDEILSVLGRNRRFGTDLVADVADQNADKLIDGVSTAQESSYTYSHYFGQRRGDENHSHRDFAKEGGFLCPSEILYAKPKRGRTASGEWKDIVNVKDYTQTLRMEKCLKPGGGCSYVSHHYKSQCSQIYNYHRLLSWSKERGLHMDIYKVPTCCTCHIMGYSYVYPPLKNDQSPASEFDFEAEFKEKASVADDKTTTDEDKQTKVISVEEVPATAIDTDGFVSAEQEAVGESDNPKSELDSFVKSVDGETGPSFFGVKEAAQPSVSQPTAVSAPPGPADVGKTTMSVPNRRTNPNRQRPQHNNNRPRLPSMAVPTNNRRIDIDDGSDIASHKYESIPLDEALDDSRSASPPEAHNKQHKGDNHESPASASTKNDEAEPSKTVNYGYHPIIDFFDRYRFDSAAAAS